MVVEQIVGSLGAVCATINVSNGNCSLSVFHSLYFGSERLNVVVEHLLSQIEMNYLKRMKLDFDKFQDWINAINQTPIVSFEEEDAIVTHNGIFHCDEVMACALIKVLPQHHNLKICRTRNPSLIEKGVIVVDVGGIYNPLLKRFDHHQPSFSETFYGSEKPERKTKLSSAGLVFKTYGMDIINHLYPHLNEEETKLIHHRVYNKFIEEIDGLDNGVEMCVGEKNYQVNSTLTSRVALLRPYPEDKFSVEELVEEQNSRFGEAMEMVATDFFAFLDYQVKAWLPARSLVKDAVQNAFKIHPSGRILRLERYIPWKPHLKHVENELGMEGQFLFCIFKQNEDNWVVQACPDNVGEFSIRVPLKWKGLRDQDLVDASGISGCIFVHVSGFMGSNKTYEGALKMAEACLSE